MSKRKSKSAPPAADATPPTGDAAAPEAVEFEDEATEESTNPDLDATPSEVPLGEDTAPFEAGAPLDTQVGGETVAEWDGPTGTEASAETTAVEVAPVARLRPRTRFCRKRRLRKRPSKSRWTRSRRGAWVRSSRACCLPATSPWVSTS